MANPYRFQMQIWLSYRHEPRSHPRVREYLDAGHRIVELLRTSDQEAVVTLAAPEEAPPGGRAGA